LERLEFKSQQVALKFEQRVEFFNLKIKIPDRIGASGIFWFVKKIKG
jgi:hypothetical protein